MNAELPPEIRVVGIHRDVAEGFDARRSAGNRGAVPGASVPEGFRARGQTRGLMRGGEALPERTFRSATGWALVWIKGVAQPHHGSPGTLGRAPGLLQAAACATSFPESMPQAEGVLTLTLAPLSCQPVSQVLRWAAVRVSAAAVGTGPTGVRKCGGVSGDR